MAPAMPPGAHIAPPISEGPIFCRNKHRRWSPGQQQQQQHKTTTTKTATGSISGSAEWALKKNQKHQKNGMETQKLVPFFCQYEKNSIQGIFE